MKLNYRATKKLLYEFVIDRTVVFDAEEENPAYHSRVIENINRFK